MLESTMAPGPHRARDSGAARALRLALWPLLVGLFAGATVLGFERLGPLWAFSALPAVIVAAALALESALPLGRRTPWNDPEVGRDIAHALLGNTLGYALGEAAFVFAAAAIAGALSEQLGGTLWPRGWPLAAQALLVVFLADGLEYLRHRWLHTVPRLWPIHALHHDVDRLHALKGGRLHFLDMSFRSLVVFAPLVVLGAPREALWWYPVAVTLLGPLAHTSADLRFPAWLHRVLVTPPQHAVHHARDPRLSARNLAPVFPLWDIAFGTFEAPGAERPEPGLEGAVIAPRFRAQLLSPWTLQPRVAAAAQDAGGSQSSAITVARGSSDSGGSAMASSPLGWPVSTSPKTGRTR